MINDQWSMTNENGNEKVDYFFTLQNIKLWIPVETVGLKRKSHDVTTASWLS